MTTKNKPKSSEGKGITSGIYKGWGIGSAIKDLMNLKIEVFELDKFPDWFKNQYKKQDT